MSCEQRRRPAAFSLVEIMVVLVIIGLLASAVTIGVRGYLIKAKQNTARKEIATIVQALETFYATYGRYPTTDEGLAILTKTTEKLPAPLLSGDPKDPWSNPYEYKVPGAGNPYDVICCGGDGKEGGDGENADIRSDKLKE
jgi:general secretion pathway protein G